MTWMLTATGASVDLRRLRDDDMPLDRALHLAELWAAGKLIGGDAHGVAVALLREVKRLRGA